MLAHREQSILRQHDKDPQHNDKNLHGLFRMFVCFAGKLKTGDHLFIEVLGCCGPHKFLVQCGPYKRILC